MIDAAGCLQVTDRMKDVIKTGGEWVSSLELESIISVPGGQRGGGDQHQRTTSGASAVAADRAQRKARQPPPSGTSSAMSRSIPDAGQISRYAIPDQVRSSIHAGQDQRRQTEQEGDARADRQAEPDRRGENEVDNLIKEGGRSRRRCHGGADRSPQPMPACRSCCSTSRPGKAAEGGVVRKALDGLKKLVPAPLSDRIGSSISTPPTTTSTCRCSPGAIVIGGHRQAHGLEERSLRKKSACFCRRPRSSPPEHLGAVDPCARRRRRPTGAAALLRHPLFNPPRYMRPGRIIAPRHQIPAPSMRWKPG